MLRLYSATNIGVPMPYALGSGLEGWIPGECNIFKIIAWDSRSRTHDSINCDVVLSTTDNCQITWRAVEKKCNLNLSQMQVHDHKDGSYTVAYRSERKTSDCTLHLSVSVRYSSSNRYNFLHVLTYFDLIIIIVYFLFIIIILF